MNNGLGKQYCCIRRWRTKF